MAFSVPDPFVQAIRQGLPVWYTADATLAGSPVAGGQDLAPSGGTVVDTSKPGVRRLLNLELPPSPGLFDVLSPIGTRLSVTAHVRYPSRQVVDIPMGLFVVDRESFTEGGGGLSLTAPDKWSLIQRARFVKPESSVKGIQVKDQIVALLRGALGPSEPVNMLATSDALMPTMTWEKDRDQAILKLASDIGAWVFFDRLGVATVADVPTVGKSADWLVDASATGVLTSLSRERSRAGTANVVVVESSASGDPEFPTQTIFDNDSSSPTYAGPDPVGSPQLAGPFGVVVEYYDTPLPLSVTGARKAGYTVLSRLTGLASQVSLGQVPNPAVDAFDVLDVMPPKERYDIPRVLERHVADTVTHPLSVGSEQSIEGRSTRVEDFA